MTDGFDTRPCGHCNGRGYVRCDCWPGDCICGEDDRDCPVCDGEGDVWIDDDYWDGCDEAGPYDPCQTADPSKQ
jgi:hypothetical protein